MLVIVNILFFVISIFLLIISYRNRKIQTLRNNDEINNISIENNDLKLKLAAADKDIIGLIESSEAFKNELNILINDKMELSKTCSIYNERLSGYKEFSDNQINIHSQQISSKDDEINKLKNTILSLTERNNELNILAATSKKDIENKNKIIEEKISVIENAEKKLSIQFENIANKIFDEKSRFFNDYSKVNIESMLKPFKDDLDKFEKKVSHFYHEEGRQRAGLEEQVKTLYNLNQQMTADAQNLTKALKGDKKIQGNWGEVILERVLETSGLRKGEEYITQKGFKDEYGKTYFPDVIVRLPGGKDIIIDSKVSLNAYSEYVAAETDEDKKYWLAKHVSALKDHLNNLSNKNYENLKDINSLDYILMFMPIESAFITALQTEEKLFNDMFKKRLIIVSPTTLLSTLGAIRYSWKSENQSKNVAEITSRGKLLLDKFRGFTDDIESIGKHITLLSKSYEGAYNKLSRGSGNLIQQATRLANLGIEQKKPFSPSLLDNSEK